jgi:hypothetical protein
MEMQERMLAENAFFNAQGRSSASAPGGGVPNLNCQSSLIYWQDSTTGTWKLFVHNYDTNTSSTIYDTQVDYTLYTDVNNDYIIESAGYALIFDNFGTDDRIVFFVTAGGTVIDSAAYNTATLSERRNFEFSTIVFSWVDGAQTNFRIFDGNRVGIASLPFAASSIDFDTNDGETTKNKSISLKVDSTYAYVLTPAGSLVDVTPLIGTNYDSSAALQGTFFVFVKLDGSDVPIELVVLSEEGVQLNSFDLTPFNIVPYSNTNRVYGENRWSGLFEINGGADWGAVKYEYATNSFVFATPHEYGNFFNYNRYVDYREPTDAFPNDRPNAVYKLSDSGSFNVWGDNHDYLAFVWSIGSAAGWGSVDVTNGTTREFFGTSDSLYSKYPSFLLGPAGGSGLRWQCGLPPMQLGARVLARGSSDR